MRVLEIPSTPLYNYFKRKYNPGLYMSTRVMPDVVYYLTLGILKLL